MVSEIDYQREKNLRVSHINAFSDLSIKWGLWSGVRFVALVCMENGTAVVMGVVKRVIWNVVIKYEVPIARSVAGHITDGPVLDCKKDKS